MGKDHSNAVSRAERKAKKRKAEDAIPDLPGDVDDSIDTPETGSGAGKKKHKKRKHDDDQDGIGDGDANGKEERKEKKRKLKEAGLSKGGEEVGVVEKKRKKSKKEKMNGEDSTDSKEEATTAEEGVEPEDEVPKKSKKERKAERRAKEVAEAAAVAKETKRKPSNVDVDVASKVNGEDASAIATEEKKSRKNNRNREKKRKGESGTEDAEKDEDSKKPPRFIVFVGNLPFTATKESVTAHFASIKPSSIRLLTQKDNPTKSKGCAFVEFDGYDHMKTCLKLFHGSLFDDGKSEKRKINVELTAGGGGNTKQRREKIEVKNGKLNEERGRRIQEEEKAKLGKKAGGEVKLDDSGIHPSRRARVAV